MPSGADQQRRIVAGVRVESAARRVDARVAERHEAAARHVAAEQPVDAGADRAGRGPFLREGADGRLQVRHQQRRRHALAGDVRDRDAQRRCRRSACRSSRRRRRWPAARTTASVEPGELRRRRRQQAALDQPRLLELALLLRVAAARSRCASSISRCRISSSVTSSHGFCTKLLRAAAHRLDGGVDAAPSGHHDDRQRAVEGADLGDELEPFSPRGRIPAIVQIHQQQIERPLAQPLEHGVGGADELGS